MRRWRCTRRAEGHDDVHEEEGQPADDERRHDDRHRPRRLTLLRQRYLRAGTRRFREHPLMTSATFLDFFDSAPPLFAFGTDV